MDNLSHKLIPVKTHSECIILLHGLARTSRCMKSAATIAQQYGYKVILLDYPSTKKPIEQLVQTHLLPVIRQCEQAGFKNIHFLTHSMGGILIRYCFTLGKPKNLGKTVMLAPPNQGSEIVDKLAHLGLFKILNGPAGIQLGTDKQSLSLKLGTVEFDTGIIAGNKSFNPLLSMLIKGENDGKVSVEKTKVLGMKDFLLLPHTHTFIMQRKQTIHQALYFIQNGYFNKTEETAKL